MPALRSGRSIDMRPLASRPAARPTARVALCLVALWWPVSGLSAQDPELLIGPASELYTNLTLIDGRGGDPQPNAAILVWNGRIRQAGPRSSIQEPQGTQIIDLEGAFVLPGYIDAQSAPRDSATLASMLAAGITGVREGAMPLERFTRLGRDIPFDGPLPTVFIGGPMLEGPEGTGGLSIPSGDDVRSTVERLIDEDDARFLSVGPTVPPAWVREIARASRGGDASVWVEQRSDGWLTALRMGADVTAGLISLDPDLVGAEHREAYIATLARSRSDALDEWLSLIDPGGAEVQTAVSALLSRDAAIIPLLSTVDEQTTAHWPVALTLTRMLYEENVRLLAGSGVPAGSTSAGRFHRELELLVEAGVPPIDVLSIATRNGAIALGELHRRGTIEADKTADFVILGADPTADIRNTRRIRAIVLDGRGWVPLPEGGFERIRFR